jgi:hypothetical protein
MLRNHQLGFTPPDNRGLFFQSWLYVEEDGAIVVVEHYSFLRQRAREEKKPGYSDHLFIPASYFEAFLLLVAQHCQREVAPREIEQTSPGEERVRLLFELLDQLEGKQKLGKASPIGESHRTLRRWLEKAAFPYEVVRSVWHIHSDDDHVFIDGTGTGGVQQAVEALVARVNAPTRRKKKETYQLVHRSPKDGGSFFSLSVSIDEAGCLIFHEEYNYVARGDDEGREYHYYMTIPAAHFKEALVVFARQCERDVPAVVALPGELLLECLRSLVARGLGSSERINAAIIMLQRWLNQAGIPYRLSKYAW